MADSERHFSRENIQLPCLCPPPAATAAAPPPAAAAAARQQQQCYRYHNAAESLFVRFGDGMNHHKYQLEKVVEAAGFIYPVYLRAGYDTGSVHYGIFSTAWRDPLSPTQLRSIPNFDEFTIKYAKISAPQQFALVQACRSLVLHRCKLDEGGKGLVDAIVEQQVFERERTILDIIPAFRVDALSRGIICSFLPNHRLAQLAFSWWFEYGFPFEDEQALRLFSCLHNKQARDQSTSALKLILLECRLEALLRGQRPRAVQFLVDKLSAAFISGETAMQWLSVDSDSGAAHQLTADAVHAAVAQSNPETVAANVDRILEGLFPFPGAWNTTDNLQRLHDHAMEALADAVVSSAAAL